MRSSTNVYLAALAIFDMLYLIITFVMSLSHYPRVTNPEFYLYWRFRPFAYMLTDACSNTSVWLTVTFTFERFIAVSYPIRGKVLCTESRAKKAIIGVALICFACTTPTPFEWTIIQETNTETNVTILREDFSDLGNNRLYKTIYYWFTVVVFILIPLFLLAIFNSFLIRSVHLSKKTRKTMTSRRDSSRDSSSQENKITVMLIAVVILFLVCQLPTAIMLLYQTFTHVEPNSNLGCFVLGLGNIFNFLVAVNAAGNFLLYCLLSQKYRRTFLQTFCPCLKGRITWVYQNTLYSNVNNGRMSASRTSVDQIVLEKVNRDLRRNSVISGGEMKPFNQDCGNAYAFNNDCVDCSLKATVGVTDEFAHSPKKKTFSGTLFDKIRQKPSPDNDETSQNWSNFNREKHLVRSVSDKWHPNSK